MTNYSIHKKSDDSIVGTIWSVKSIKPLEMNRIGIKVVGALGYALILWCDEYELKEI